MQPHCLEMLWTLAGTGVVCSVHTHDRLGYPSILDGVRSKPRPLWCIGRALSCKHPGMSNFSPSRLPDNDGQRLMAHSATAQRGKSHPGRHCAQQNPKFGHAVVIVTMSSVGGSDNVRRVRPTPCKQAGEPHRHPRGGSSMQ